MPDVPFDTGLGLIRELFNYFSTTNHIRAFNFYRVSLNYICIMDIEICLRFYILRNKMSKNDPEKPNNIDSIEKLRKSAEEIFNKKKF